MERKALRTELKSVETFFFSILLSLLTYSATFIDLSEPENTVEDPIELVPPMLVPLFMLGRLDFVAPNLTWPLVDSSPDSDDSLAPL